MMTSSSETEIQVSNVVKI